MATAQLTVRTKKEVKSMKHLNIKQLVIRDKAFYGHSGRPGKTGGSQAARGSSRATKPVSSVYPKVTPSQKIRAVARFARQSGYAGAISGARSGMKIGATAGGLIGGLALPALGTLTGSMVGAMSGIQYGAMIGQVKGCTEAFLSLGNRSKMLEIYKRSTSAALKASARETVHEVVGTGLNFAKSYAIRFAASKVYDFAVGKMFEAKTGRKWSDFKDFIKNKKKQQAYQAWQGKTSTEANWLNKTPRLPGHAFQATQTINLKPRKKDGKVVWSKEIVEPDILQEWPTDLTTILANFDKRVAKLQKAGEDMSGFEDAFYNDMDALVNEIDAGSTKIEQ